MAAAARPAFAGFDQGAAQALATGIGRHEQFGQEAVTAFRLGDEQLAMFFMGEYANMIASSAMMVTLFLGGWTLPWWGLDQPAHTIGGGILSIVIFLAKVCALMLFFIWVRWTLPRFRYDQVMDLGWRRLLPIALANIFVTGLAMFALQKTVG